MKFKERFWESKVGSGLSFGRVPKSADEGVPFTIFHDCTRCDVVSSESSNYGVRLPSSSIVLDRLSVQM